MSLQVISSASGPTCFFFFFGPCCTAWGTLACRPGVEPTGPPGKFQGPRAFLLPVLSSGKPSLRLHLWIPMSYQDPIHGLPETPLPIHRDSSVLCSQAAFTTQPTQMVGIPGFPREELLVHVPQGALPRNWSCFLVPHTGDAQLAKWNITG